IAGVPSAEVHLGVDGCTVPTFAMPMASAATAYARLMEPDSLPSSRRYAAHRAVEAMMSHPEMVAGESRLDTDIMTAAPGELIAKAGAEGYYAIGFRRGGRGFGVALKVADGDNDRARMAVVLRVLASLELLPSDRV